MTMETLLEPFLGLFHCAGEEFHFDECDDAVMMEVVTPAAIKSATSNPTLYSMPSREKMEKFRLDTLERYRSSPLFSTTTTVSVDDHYDHYELFAEHRDDSMRSTTSSGSEEVRQSLCLTPPRKSSVSTAAHTTSTPRKRCSQSTPPRRSLIAS